MSQLTRRQLRRLIKEEYYNVTKSKQLNESAAIAFAGLSAAAIVGITALTAHLDRQFNVPTDSLTGEPLYIQEYDVLGKAIIDGVKPKDAVVAALNKNSKLADSFKSSTASEPYDEYEERQGYSDKYGAQDPTYDKYDNLGLYEKRSRKRRR
jgi:hypothetical protein